MTRQDFLLVCALCAAVAHSKVTRLVIFGDSLSDDGVDDKDKYGFKRGSSGDVWNEYVGRRFCLPIMNYAMSGGRSGTGNFYFDDWAGVAWQVSEYVKNNGGEVPDGDLVLYQAGGVNDFSVDGLRHTEEAEQVKNVEADGVRIGINNVGNIRNLLDAGVQSILVLLLGDPAGVPETEKLPSLSRFRLEAGYADDIIERHLKEFRKNYTARIEVMKFGDILLGFPSAGLKREPYKRKYGTKRNQQFEYGFIHDDVHPSDPGHQVIAKEIGKKLKDTLMKDEDGRCSHNDGSSLRAIEFISAGMMALLRLI